MSKTTNTLSAGQISYLTKRVEQIFQKKISDANRLESYDNHVTAALKSPAIKKMLANPVTVEALLIRIVGFSTPRLHSGYASSAKLTRLFADMVHGDSMSVTKVRQKKVAALQDKQTTILDKLNFGVNNSDALAILKEAAEFNP